MRGQWEFYMCPVDDYLASIALDIGISEELPLAGMDWLVAVSVLLEQPVTGGFTSPEEYPILCEMEEKLASSVEKELGGVEVGRVTGGGTRDFLFYLPTINQVSETVESVMSGFSHQYKIHQHEEPKWETYWEFLYPNPYQMHTIQNRHILERMIQQGDEPTISRRVDHFAYLPDEEKAKLFVAELEVLDEWQMVSMTFEEGKELPWAIHMACEQPIDLITMNQKCGRIFEEAYHLGGRYDGWGSNICKQ